jgi:hypothetical protein
MAVLKSHAGIGYLISAILHAGLLATFTWHAVPLEVRPVAPTRAVETSLSDRSGELGPHNPWSVAQARLAADGERAAPDSPADEGARLANSTTVDSPPHASSAGLGEFARERLEHARHETETKSSEEQLADLESLARRLGSISSEEPVREVTETLSKWLGTDKRATQPATAAETRGPFDVDTAQVTDVKQVETDGVITYVAVLVDAQGNPLETPLNETDGPQLFKTFQLMKRFPLLETVYHGAVMGLLDKLAQSPSGTVASERQPHTEADPQQQ